MTRFHFYFKIFPFKFEPNQGYNIIWGINTGLKYNVEINEFDF